MDVKNILAHCDHTNLKPTATRADIRRLCDEALQYHTASVCVPASYVTDARRYLGGRMKVCTVIGFPNGYDTSAAKAFMAADAIKKGADEIDMVVNLGWVRDEKDTDVEAEIAMVKEACGDHVLKVIIECCLLTVDEKIRMCWAVTHAGADYIKTSTGFSTGGATFDDVRLLRQYCGPGVKIKAAGGISTLQDASEFLRFGADRLGTSRIVKLVQQMEAQGN
ncbi:MAG: deoxyribose-phosphate aldolase [Lachnospiraceae bacterium]|nr:deoxyribose-phosphate aldolase [Lachnospiraceae bacterium]